MSITRPMLAKRLKSLEDLAFPVLLTPKIDGIRCLVVDGQALTRSFKPIPNVHIRECIERYVPEGADGELIVPGDFQSVQSAVMSEDGTPSFQYMVFDYAPCLTVPYSERASRLTSWASFVTPVYPVLVSTVDEFLAFESSCLTQGYEGVIGRVPSSVYECKRSKLMFKFKRYTDAEAVVIGFEEQLQNCNEIEYNVFGYAKRPGGKEGKEGKNTLGSFLVRDVLTSVTFSVGTGLGLTAALRQQIWDNQEQYLGKTITYRYQEVGTDMRPRFPVWLGFRSDHV